VGVQWGVSRKEGRKSPLSEKTANRRQRQL
jgi:hypothetical protein